MPVAIGLVAEQGSRGPVATDPFSGGTRIGPAPDVPVGSWVRVEDGEVTAVLAAPDSPEAALYAIAAKHALSPVHTDVEQAEADALAADAPRRIADPTLVDLTHLPFVTIDEVTSKDLDQAVFVDADGDGFVVWYALADASAFVRPGTALYEASLQRGSSYYLPGLVVPMLPRVLSEDVVSLNPRVDRRAMVFELRLDPTGALVERTVHRARVHCREKLDFDGVQAFLDGTPVDWAPDVQASLRRLQQVGERRIRLADERNVVRYRRTEVEVKVRGHRFVALDGPRNDVERYNEQISLLTNIEGARLLREGQEAIPEVVQPIYRVHAPPDSERFEELRVTTLGIARAHGLDPEVWAWNPEREGLHAYLDRLPHDPEAEGAVAQAIHRQAMIINRPSHYASAPGMHFGVGADVYGRFTAPMREVVGIFVHDEVWELSRGASEPVPDGWDGEALRERVIDASNRARELQRRLDREANRIVLDDLLGPLEGKGPVLAGRVLGLTATRVHVQLASPPIDVKVYVAHLERAWGVELERSEDGAELRGGDHTAHHTVRMGDQVTVEVVGRDSRRDRWTLTLG